jgi:hypothetical protein
MENAEGFAFEMNGDYLLCSSRRRKPTDLVPLLGTLKGFNDRIPNVAYGLYGTAGEAGPPAPTFTA